MWRGQPWITPGVIVRTVVVIVVAVLVAWLEFFLGVADLTLDLPIVSIMPVVLWTALVFFLAWVFSLMHLLLLRASNTYILHSDSLEIRSGILTSKSFVVSASGFADLEVVRTVLGRILESGDIIIRTQSETDAERRIQRIREPLKVADQIRKVMAHPIVRLEGGQPPK
jgi:membrane protein YdbS with pleckstrin-like domain